MGNFAHYKSPIPLVRDYYSSYSACSLGDLYDAIELYDDALLAYSINNAYIVVACEHRTLALCYNGPTKDHFYDYGMHVPSTVPAGYVQTTPGVLDHFTPPYHLPYSPTTRQVFLQGSWMYIDFIPEIDPPISLYLSLKDTNKLAALIDSATGKEVFL